jgi:hypothetical protein
MRPRHVALFLLAVVAHAANAIVPFVGCPSDGQTGPVDAPRAASKSLPIPAAAAQQLAYYQADQGLGVLAPRGWHCFGVYGSNGASLYVTPDPIDSKRVFSDSWAMNGPAVQVSLDEGGTSGRFEVARIVARIFPAHRDFVNRVIAERIVPASSFPSGPYPNDKLTYKHKDLVEYETPAESDGLGTQSPLGKSADPIRGAAIFSPAEPTLTVLFVRLPRALSGLSTVIIRQFER